MLKRFGFFRFLGFTFLLWVFVEALGTLLGNTYDNYGFCLGILYKFELCWSLWAKSCWRWWIDSPLQVILGTQKDFRTNQSGPPEKVSTQPLCELCLCVKPKTYLWLRLNFVAVPLPQRDLTSQQVFCLLLKICLRMTLLAVTVATVLGEYNFKAQWLWRSSTGGWSEQGDFPRIFLRCLSSRHVIQLMKM